jgi:hypothetical protein
LLWSAIALALQTGLSRFIFLLFGKFLRPSRELLLAEKDGRTAQRLPEGSLRLGARMGGFHREEVGFVRSRDVRSRERFFFVEDLSALDVASVAPALAFFFLVGGRRFPGAGFGAAAPRVAGGLPALMYRMRGAGPSPPGTVYARTTMPLAWSVF